jgi:hypothetical protein
MNTYFHSVITKIIEQNTHVIYVGVGALKARGKKICGTRLLLHKQNPIFVKKIKISIVYFSDLS